MIFLLSSSFCFFFNATAPTEIYTLSLHDALPISVARLPTASTGLSSTRSYPIGSGPVGSSEDSADRKSTRLNSSHEWISYAVFCLKKKKKKKKQKVVKQKNTKR